MSRQPFLLYARGGVWYYKLPGDTAYHTTHLKHTRKADRSIADAWVLDLLQGRLPGAPRAGDPTLEAIGRDFFDPGGSYVRRQRAKKRPFGDEHAGTCQAYLDNWILPKFGRRRLSTLRSRKEIEDWLISLALENATKNHILYAFRAVLQDAVEDGQLEKSPLDRVEALGVMHRERDVFSVADYRVLFPQGHLAEVWGSFGRGVYFLVLAGAGLREGEGRALSWAKILWKEKALLVNVTVQGGSGGRGVIGPISEKKGGARIALLGSRVLEDLREWQRLSIWKRPEDLVFPGKARGVPISAATITHSLARAFERLDGAAADKQLPPLIDRTDRNLVGHSFRHTYVTRLRRLAPRGIVPQLVGHQNEETTDLYDHPTQLEIIGELEPARTAVDAILSP
jgi:integrase